MSQAFYVLDIRFFANGKSRCLQAADTKLDSIQRHDLFLSAGSQVLNEF